MKLGPSISRPWIFLTIKPIWKLGPVTFICPAWLIPSNRCLPMLCITGAPAAAGGRPLQRLHSWMLIFPTVAPVQVLVRRSVVSVRRRCWTWSSSVAHIKRFYFSLGPATMEEMQHVEEEQEEQGSSSRKVHVHYNHTLPSLYPRWTARYGLSLESHLCPLEACQYSKTQMSSVFNHAFLFGFFFWLTKFIHSWISKLCE